MNHAFTLTRVMSGEEHRDATSFLCKSAITYIPLFVYPHLKKKMLEEKWYRARQYMPDILVRCRHGTNPACECVTRFNVDKNDPLTKQQQITTAVKFELNRMERVNEQDEAKLRLLNRLSQCDDNVEAIYDDEYRPRYGCLTPSSPRRSKQGNKFSIPLIVLIILIFLSIALIITINPNTWHSTKYFYTRAVFASHHLINT